MPIEFNFIDSLLKVSDFNSCVSLNASVPILITFSRLIVSIFVHPLKACCSIVLTEFGNEISFKDPTSLKAWGPMFIKFVPTNLIDSKLVDSNAPVGINLPLTMLV